MRKFKAFAVMVISLIVRYCDAARTEILANTGEFWPGSLGRCLMSYDLTYHIYNHCPRLYPEEPCSVTMTTCWYPQHTLNNWRKVGNRLFRGWPRSLNLKISPKSIFCSPLVYLPYKSFIVFDMAGTESIGKSDQLPEQMTSHPQGESSDGLLPGDHWTQTTNVRLQFPAYHMLEFHLLKSLCL